MYAIVEVGGKQYKVEKDGTVYVPRLSADVDSTVTFDRVLLMANGDDTSIGSPSIDGASVSATVLEHVKADKVLVFKKKRRKRYKVMRGHRQQYTRVKINELSSN
jgi:large subunit ribosomal protein L21